MAGNIASHLDPRSAFTIEGAEDTAFERAIRLLIIVIIDHHGDSHDVAHEQKLVAAGIGDLAGHRQDLSQFNQLIRSQIHFYGKGMEMADCGLQQFFGSGRNRVIKGT